MKRFLFAFVVIVFSFSLHAERKVMLAVMDILDENKLFTERELDSAAEYLRGQLAASGRFIVVAKDRQNKERTRIMRSESYKQCYDASCQIPLGQSLSADTILTGRITHLLGRYTLTVELVDLAKEATIDAASYNFHQKNEMLQVLDDVVNKLVGIEKEGDLPTVAVVEKTPPPPVIQKPVIQEEPVSAMSQIERERRKREELEHDWRTLRKLLNDKTISKDHKRALVSEFIKKYPQDNKYRMEARNILKNLNSLKPTGVNHILNREKYRTGTEWMSLSFAMGNYGFGGNISFFTLRWNNFYWEIFRYQWMLFPTWVKGFSVNGKTTFGFPVFIAKDNRHEFRFGTGFSGGISAKSTSYTYDSGYSWDSFEEIVWSRSFFNIPLEVSYVFHAARYFAFQTGLSLEFPIIFNNDGLKKAKDSGDYDGSTYIPIFSFFIGFRI